MDAGWLDYWQLLQDSGADLWDGLQLTLVLWFCSCLMGFVLALALAWAATSGPRWSAAAARAYGAALRGTPLLVQMFIIYYGLGQFAWIRASWSWAVLQDAEYCGLLALTLNIAAYMAEDLRAAILAVPHAQLEAAQSYGMGHGLLWRRIVLPLALRIATPALGNELIAQLKATALVSTITVFDLTARRISVESYTTNALVLAGVVYALLTLLISLGVHALERARQGVLRR